MTNMAASSPTACAFRCEVVQAVRTAIGDDMPLLYRMSGHDYVDGGLTEADSIPFAKELEPQGWT